ncbi:MAG: hypothetical protein IKC05_06050 [Lentisphaeria bacterium]|nr:hypothetical protein [Lentisphaeria bacterium]
MKKKNVKKYIQFYFWDYLYFRAAFQMEHQINERILPYVEENHCPVQPFCSEKTVHPADTETVLPT